MVCKKLITVLFAAFLLAGVTLGAAATPALAGKFDFMNETERAIWTAPTNNADTMKRAISRLGGERWKDTFGLYMSQPTLEEIKSFQRIALLAQLESAYTLNLSDDPLAKKLRAIKEKCGERWWLHGGIIVLITETQNDVTRLRHLIGNLSPQALATIANLRVNPPNENSRNAVKDLVSFITQKIMCGEKFPAEFLEAMSLGAVPYWAAATLTTWLTPPPISAVSGSQYRPPINSSVSLSQAATELSACLWGRSEEEKQAMVATGCWSRYVTIDVNKAKEFNSWVKEILEYLVEADSICDEVKEDFLFSFTPLPGRIFGLPAGKFVRQEQKRAITTDDLARDLRQVLTLLREQLGDDWPSRFLEASPTWPATASGKEVMEKSTDAVTRWIRLKDNAQSPMWADLVDVTKETMPWDRVLIGAAHRAISGRELSRQQKTGPAQRKWEQFVADILLPADELERLHPVLPDWLRSAVRQWREQVGYSWAHEFKQLLDVKTATGEALTSVVDGEVTPELQEALKSAKTTLGEAPEERLEEWKETFPATWNDVRVALAELPSQYFDGELLRRLGIQRKRPEAVTLSVDRTSVDDRTSPQRETKVEDVLNDHAKGRLKQFQSAILSLLESARDKQVRSSARQLVRRIDVFLEAGQGPTNAMDDVEREYRDLKSQADALSSPIDGESESSVSPPRVDSPFRAYTVKVVLGDAVERDRTRWAPEWQAQLARVAEMLKRDARYSDGGEITIPRGFGHPEGEFLKLRLDKEAGAGTKIRALFRHMRIENGVLLKLVAVGDGHPHHQSKGWKTLAGDLAEAITLQDEHRTTL